MKRFAIACASMALLIGFSQLAGGVITKTWVVESYKDWDEGDAKDALITSLGEVRAGWTTQRTAVEVDGIWAATRDSAGDVILGTDDEGAIYRVKGGKAAKLATIPDVVAVVSLVAGADGTVYAGTMPEGQIWAVKNGKASKLADLAGAETVWGLTLSTNGKQLYAGTGPEGKLFAVNLANRKVTVAFDTEDKRIMSVATTSDGAIWMGTSEKAQVFRYDPARNSTRAMADFSGNEITGLEPQGSAVLAIANEFDEPSTSGFKTKAAVDKADKDKKDDNDGIEPKRPAKDSTPGADEAQSSSAETPRKGGRKGKGTLYRIHGDSRVEQLHALTSTYFTDVVADDNGRVFAGAGDKGRVYMVDTDGAISTAFDVEERLVAALVYDKSAGLSFATSDASAYYRSAGAAKKASYTSDVWDTKAPARFGRIAWRGEGRLRVQTRSGNTAEPDKGWSSWSNPRAIGRAGGASSGGKVTSPMGRYFQFKVTFDDQDAVLRSATLYYLPQNKATRLESVEVDDSARRSSSPVTTRTGATKPRSPILKVKWKIDNPDGDKTTYKLAVRREGEVLWRPINTGKTPLTATDYSWNTETFPDGWYRLRVSASDRESNAESRAMESHRTSALFRVDNEKPSISGINVRYPRASARALDTLSPIAEVAFSVDDKPWQLADSQDGLFDDASEMLRITLPDDLTPGVHTLSIRCADEAGNIGSASVTFRVK